MPAAVHLVSRITARSEPPTGPGARRPRASLQPLAERETQPGASRLGPRKDEPGTVATRAFLTRARARTFSGQSLAVAERDLRSSGATGISGRSQGSWVFYISPGFGSSGSAAGET